MDDLETSDKVLAALESAAQEPAPAALPILNGLAGLVQGGGEQPFEIQDARAEVFMAICELGKALHRGQPADRLWTPAIGAARRWRTLLSRSGV